MVAIAQQEGKLCAWIDAEMSYSEDWAKRLGVDTDNLIVSQARTINEMVNSASPVDVDDITKIAKGKVDALKIKDSAIKIKLEIAKLQNDIIKNNGDAESAIKQRSGGEVSLDDFSKIREMIKNGNNEPKSE
jgi:hypothetical protein